MQRQRLGDLAELQGQRHAAVGVFVHAFGGVDSVLHQRDKGRSAQVVAAHGRRALTDKYPDANRVLLGAHHLLDLSEADARFVVDGGDRDRVAIGGAGLTRDLQEIGEQVRIDRGEHEILSSHGAPHV